MQIWFLIMMFVFGACMGSFLCCQVRRLHLRTLKEKQKEVGKRSICLECGYKLKWYDNLPIISWLMLRGKCRKCGKKIGVLEIISEIAVGVALVLLGSTVDVATAGATEWLILGIGLMLVFFLAFLAIYDGEYGELPVIYLVMSIICAGALLIVKEWTIASVSGFSWEMVWQPALAVLLLGGLYLVLYLVSKGKWVGDGDWLLGVAIGLALGNPWLSLIVLFLANVVACVVMLLMGKGKRGVKVHFGPFMVMAFVVVYSFAEFLNSLIVF